MSLFSFPQEVQASLLLNGHLSVRAAADASGYSVQYLRRLLRDGKLEGVKIGQMWLIELDSLIAYLEYALGTGDLRCGPRGPRDGKVAE